MKLASASSDFSVILTQYYRKSYILTDKKESMFILIPLIKDNMYSTQPSLCLVFLLWLKLTVLALPCALVK